MPIKPPKRWKRQIRLKREARDRQKVASIRQELIAMTLANFIGIAEGNGNGLLGSEARKLFLERTGQTWSDYQKMKARQVQTRSETDFLKPKSKEYDMPEYDLE